MENRIDDKFILRWAKKYRAVQDLGGKCNSCGTDDIFILDFHHRDPNEKEDGLAILFKRGTWDEIKREIDKCDLLCRNCHHSFHMIDVKERFHNVLDQIKVKAEIIETLARPKLNEEYIREMLEKGYSLNYIARSLSKDVSTIRTIAVRIEEKTGKTLVVKRDDYNRANEKISNEKLIELYSQGKKVSEIAKEYQMQKSTLFERVKKLKEKNLLK